MLCNGPRPAARGLRLFFNLLDRRVGRSRLKNKLRARVPGSRGSGQRDRSEWLAFSAPSASTSSNVNAFAAITAGAAARKP